MIGSQFGYALLTGLIPPLIWLFFWLREDSSHPEPRSLLAGCFFAGMLAVLFAIPAEQYVAGLGLSRSAQYISWAAIEELLKFFAVAAIALRSRWYDEPIDPMIYLIAVSLGFAALENTLFIMGPFAQGDLARGLVTGNMRFIGATLVHVVCSTLIGFGLGWNFYRSKAVKLLGWIGAATAAIALHSAFNLTIVNASAIDTLKAFGWIWGAVVIMIVLFEEVKAVRPRLV